jgi:hypothetical protein
MGGVVMYPLEIDVIAIAAVGTRKGTIGEWGVAV